MRLFTEGRKMKLKAVSGIMLTLLLIGMLTLAFDVQPIKASGTLYIGSDYTFTSNIYEPIVVTADNITIDGNGYTLEGPGSGIGLYLEGRINVTIKNTEIKSFEYGILLDWSSSNRIFGNNMTNNYVGIHLYRSGSNVIEGNTVNSSGFDGVQLVQSNDNEVSGNEVTLNGWIGIWTFQSRSNIISGNTAVSNTLHGIMLAQSNSTTVTDNKVADNNEIGILVGDYPLARPSNNTIARNIVSNNKDGICLEYSSNNTLFGNTVINNIEWGIYINTSSNNTIYHNNIIENVVQAYDSDPANNDWHHPDLLEGNHWSDYPGVDDGSGSGKHAIAGDGIGDTDIPWPDTDYDFYPFVIEIAPPVGINLLKNPDFEQQLDYWFTSMGTATYIADPSNPLSGSYSAKGVELNEGSLGRLYQDMTGIVYAGGEYQISGWIRTQGVVGYVVIGLDYVASNGWTPADGYVREIGYVTGTQDWTYYESDVFTLPPMPSDASAIWFLFDFNNGKGTAWWDDVSLIEIPMVETTDETGERKDVFDISETVYICGSGYSPLTIYDLYIVEDTTWSGGMDIPDRVSGTETSVTTDENGNIPASTEAWSGPLTPGKYDIVIDVNGNGKYDEDIDVLDDEDIEVTAGFFVIPEYWLGTILGLIGCFAAFVVFGISKSKRWHL